MWSTDEYGCALIEDIDGASYNRLYGFVSIADCNESEWFDSVSWQCVANDVKPDPSKNAGPQYCRTWGNAGTVGNPIFLGVGNKYQVEVDYVSRGNFPLEVVRIYNRISFRNYVLAPGPSWLYTFDKVVSRMCSNAACSSQQVVKLVRSDGMRLNFFPAGVNAWDSFDEADGSLKELVNGAGDTVGWQYITLDQTVEDYDAAGQLLKVTERTGLSHTYAYTVTDITVTHSNGDALVYQLTSSGQVSGFTSPDGKTYSYNYDGAGNLSGITYPNAGGTRVYHYEDANFADALTGITDENGDRFATWVYDIKGRAISSEHNGGAEKVSIDYTYIDDVIDSRATSTNALGKQTTYHFVNINGVQKVRQVEGHPSANCIAANKDYAYDSNGFLQSKTDWKGNTTAYVRNARGQETSRTEAAGTTDARTILTEWHPTFNLRTKVTEPNRQIAYNYDANGLLLSQQTKDLSVP